MDLAVGLVEWMILFITSLGVTGGVIAIDTMFYPIPNSVLILCLIVTVVVSIAGVIHFFGKPGKEAKP